jgi:putative hydrolase of the HAD superfamily
VEFDAVLLDVGGVLLLPDPAVTGAALRGAGVAHRDDALAWAHYGGVAALDAAAGDWPQGGAPGPYLQGFIRAAGVADDQVPTAVEALHEVFTAPAIDVWARLTPWAHDGLAALGTLDRPVAVVSNADGTVEAQMHRHRLAQVGPGPGLDVAAIVDSAVVGVAKPDPAVFAPALRALDVPAERCCYVGDTVTFDVAGARAAGMACIHLDPLGACTQDDHPHARTLLEAW